MSNVGAGDSYNSQPWLVKKIIVPYFLKWLQVIIDDKNIMEPDVMSSSLDWTIVRFPNIIDSSKKNSISISTNSKTKMSITAKDAAAFLVEQLESSSYSKQAISVSN